ncbi:rna polymerase sigma factor region 3/4 [Lucifera butyrica]|uniref:Rna polymerase sigma factor region 3/4 n=2 Tax=Lucifera butyrica TaxID=1351585 RepID=A0A498RAE9_9FIRM|nr:rna polymerase sigma factor region 3/4 [Lucifera butyrica]
MRNVEEVVISLEEMEALRLFDIEQMSQGAAAEKMGISHSTFHRLINKAHQKVAAALWQGKALTIEGGSYRLDHPHKNELRHFICKQCSREWDVLHGAGQSGMDMQCPNCESRDIMRQG